MNFAGLSLLQLLGVFGAASAVATALYVLKLRRRTFAVPFSPLWQRILEDKDTTTLFSRLKRLLSLLLQLALLALLAIALGDPRPQAAFVRGRSIVVLLDVSASMQATDVSPNRISRAKEEIKKLIRSLSASDRMLVAKMSTETVPLGPMSTEPLDLERLVEAVQATDSRVDFARGLRFAQDALLGLENPEVIVVSDGNLPEARDSSGVVHTGNTKVSFIPVGEKNRNVGITEFSVRRYPLDRGRYEVLLEVQNTGTEAEEVELSLMGDGQLVDISKLRLAPGERLPRFYGNLSGASRKLEAKLTPIGSSKDYLEVDNHAFALLPERRRSKVLVVTPGNTYLEAALLLDEYIDAELVSPQTYVDKKAANLDKYDVAIFDGATPQVTPKIHAIYIDPRGAGSPVKIAGEQSSPGFDKIERKHPIVRFTALDEVNIAHARRLVPQAGDRVVGASSEGPLLIAGARGGYKFVALGFDVRESDLPVRIAWPVFLINCVHFFVEDDATYLSSFRTGDVWRLGVPADATKAVAVTPSGLKENVPVFEQRAVLRGDKAGYYDLTATSEGAEVKTEFAANLLDVTESGIAPKGPLTVDGKVAGSVSGFSVGVRKEVWVTLLLAVVLIAILEWASYHRRITV